MIKYEQMILILTNYCSDYNLTKRRIQVLKVLNLLLSLEWLILYWERFLFCLNNNLKQKIQYRSENCNTKLGGGKISRIIYQRPAESKCN